MSQVGSPASAVMVPARRFDRRALIRRSEGLLLPSILVITWEAVVRAGFYPLPLDQVEKLSVALKSASASDAAGKP